MERSLIKMITDSKCAKTAEQHKFYTRRFGGQS